MALIAADTTFLIDLCRERGREEGRVHDFLGRHADDRFSVPLVAWGEFAAGFRDLTDPLYLETKASFRLLEMDEAVAVLYREIFRNLKAAGRLIGANDLWIAATARRYGLPCVTRNAGEFHRVPGLEVLTY